jgi:hypothetical protein
VVIRDLDFVRPVNLPDEADAILIVDSDAVLADAVALQRFQPVTRRDAQVAQVDGCFNLVQLASASLKLWIICKENITLSVICKALYFRNLPSCLDLNPDPNRNCPKTLHPVTLRVPPARCGKKPADLGI